MLQIYNSLTRQKEVFVPRTPGKVGMYVCGMTVYDYCHIGHGRVMVNFDTIARYLRFKGYELTYVRNITDIDDKIIARANLNQEPMDALTERFITAMHEDAQALGTLAPDQEPCATKHIAEMIAMITQLIDKGYAYVAKNGDVYYRVKQFKPYGLLANKDLDELQAGARVAITESKDNPLDFVLWKMAKAGEPAWVSPWGEGRPGWHIECSVMSIGCLGHTFDIHGGGFDLKFPHHENEIAQAEAATGEPFVHYWMHVGFVQVNKEKMSKSLGNFFTLRDVLKKYHPEVIRYFMLSSHYRSPINYSEESLELAKAGLDRLYTSLRELPLTSQPLANSPYEARFIAAMDDDFNTPVAVSVLFELVHEINRLREEQGVNAVGELAALLQQLAGVLGLLQYPVAEYRHPQVFDEAQRAHIDALVERRTQARREKDWALADSLRAELTALGVSIEDNATGTLWRGL